MIVVNRERAAILRTPHGSEIRPLIDRTTSPITLCSLAEEKLPVGAAVGPHHHVDTEEVYYILRGNGRMTVANETRDVETGDAIFIPKGAIHSLQNTGDIEMTIALVCGPAYSPLDHHPESDD